MQETGRADESVFNENVLSVEEIYESLVPITSGLTSESLSLSMSESGDWYILAEESRNGIKIHDSGLDLVGNDADDERSKLNKKMALEEYTRELLTIISEASANNKNVIIDIEREGKILPLELLKKSGILEVAPNGHVTVNDIEKLKEKIDELKTILEKERQTRMVSDIGVEQPVPPEESAEEHEK